MVRRAWRGGVPRSEAGGGVDAGAVTPSGEREDAARCQGPRDPGPVPSHQGGAGQLQRDRLTDDDSSAGLRVGQGDAGGHGPLPRPSLTAWPSAVVPEDGDVTLTCRAPIGGLGKFVLRRGGHSMENRGEYTMEHVPSPGWTESLAKFHLAGLQPSQAGEYTCDYQTRERPRETSPPSEALLLLVTGFYPKPSLQAHPRGEVTAGENVTLQCQWPRHLTEPTHFVILKAGESAPPTQVSTSQERGTVFSLPKVTPGDSGNYSCVSHMTRAPFRGSHPSESVSIQVTGLRVGQGDTGGHGPLPRPSLTAWPSAVVPEGGDVTLTCRAPIGGLGKFHLRRGGHSVVEVPPTDWTEGLAKFHLAGLQASRAGEYTCHYQRRERPRETSPPSEALLLLVTGSYPKPSLQAHPSGEVTAGENVTLQCQWPRNMTELTHFVILKAGESAPPTQVSTSHERGTHFSLPKVTAGDSGNYSCVSHMTRAPFWASRPSESVSIQVTDTQGATSEDYSKVNLIRLCLAALTVVILGVFLVEAWYGQKSPLGSR
ncbi:immunoglobulin superfamily member 1-like [Talpa occidentalis]|uniref:immunoglobulin superfamily member 1-like n=1 Tax=Talpa occidentalis TaxID=50954 RepID=UPI00188E6D1A|nr:immunoglobulin superfamily member 1-like [Talpa occidentalis]